MSGHANSGSRWEASTYSTHQSSEDIPKLESYISNPKSRNIGLNSQSDGSNLQLRISDWRCRIRAISKPPLVRVLHESSMLMPCWERHERSECKRDSAQR